MATETTNYKLIKDGPNEYYDIEKLNANLDKIDTAIGTKVDRVVGKGLSANDYTNLEKQEVAKIKDLATLHELALLEDEVRTHKADNAPHQYGGRFEWRYNSDTDSLDLVVIE